MMLTKHGKERIKSRTRKEIPTSKMIKRAAKYGITYEDMPEGKLKTYAKSKMFSYEKKARVIAYNQMIFILDRHVDTIITAYKAPIMYIKDIDELCSHKKKRIESEQCKDKKVKINERQIKTEKLLKKNSNRV